MEAPDRDRQSFVGKSAGSELSHRFELKLLRLQCNVYRSGGYLRVHFFLGSFTGLFLIRKEVRADRRDFEVVVDETVCENTTRTCIVLEYNYGCVSSYEILTKV